MMEIPKFSSTFGISSSAFVGWFLSYGLLPWWKRNKRGNEMRVRECVCIGGRGGRGWGVCVTEARRAEQVPQREREEQDSRVTWEGATTSAWGDWAADKGSIVGEGNLLDKYCKSLYLSSLLESQGRSDQNLYDVNIHCPGLSSHLLKNSWQLCVSIFSWQLCVIIGIWIAPSHVLKGWRVARANTLQSRL